MRRPFAFRIVWCVLLFACGAVARGHEPYLLLKALPDGTLEIEAGFSNNESPQDLPVTLRNRETGAVISDHRLPGDGFLSVPLPKIPYRVELDAGPGHRISKVGPTLEDAKAEAAKEAEPKEAKPADLPKAAAPATASVSTAATAPAAVAAPATVAEPAATGGGDMQRMLLVAGIFFLFGAIAFALGYGAGRKSR